MILIDGSAGEGGGQILRTALGLSLVSGKPFRIKNIRANRKKPGLMRQHLTAVQAAAEVGDAYVEGGAIGSRELIFRPQTIRYGDFHFAIGTAGSCTLVFQAILPALLVAGGASSVVLEGGTHNPMAPPFDFLTATFLPTLAKMGARISAQLERPGFFPAGGGKMRISVEPQDKLSAVTLTERSNSRLACRAVCAQLPGHIARRELGVVKEKLGLAVEDIENVELEQYGPGNVLTVFVHSDELTETLTGFGQKHLSAEKVALQVVRQVKDYLRTEAPVGMYLADQLLIPMALGGSGCFMTGRPTNHTLTNIATIQQFLEVSFRLERKTDDVWLVSL